MKLFKAVVFFLFPAMVFAQSHFKKTELHVKGEIQEVTAQDLDQDGMKELVVIHHIDTQDGSRRL